MLVDQSPPFKRNFAFLHLMRTGGTYFDNYLREQVLQPLGYETYNSYLPPIRTSEAVSRDFTDEELFSFLGPTPPYRYVHNHFWSEQVFQSYRAAGWITFSFIRDPADRLCSGYLYWIVGFAERAGIEPRYTLNQFIARALLGAQHRWLAPKFWREIDYLEETSVESFTTFCRTYFDHTYVPQRPLLATPNPGYRRLLEEGQVSPQVDRALSTSPLIRQYREMKEEIARRKTAHGETDGRSGAEQAPPLRPVEE